MSSIIEKITNLKSKVYGIESVGKQKWETLNENLLSVQFNMDQMNISGQFLYLVAYFHDIVLSLIDQLFVEFYCLFINRFELQ